MINRDHCRIDYSRFSKKLVEVHKEYLPLLPKDFISQYDDLVHLQDKLKADQTFNAAARMVRYLHKYYTKFIQDLREVSKEPIPDAVFTNASLIIPSTNIGKVIVFPYLVLDSVTSEELRNCCWIICFDVLTTFNRVRANKPKSWQPFHRAWNKIKTHEEISVIRALVRYTKIENHLTSSQIHDLAANYVDRLKPLVLIYATNIPKDFLTMFRAKGVSSCMALTTDKKQSWAGIIEHNHHPMSLFAYHPHVKGVYCVKDRIVVARTLLYEVKDNCWQYGRLFAVNSYYKKKFEEALHAEGYKYLTTTFSKHTIITVPGIYSNDHRDYLLPMPYMDNISSEVFGRFNKQSKEFTVEFGCLKKSANVAICSVGGFVMAQSLGNERCKFCGGICREETYVTFERGYIYCSDRCYEGAGYVFAITASGENQLRRASECYNDFFNTRRYYTSQYSCVSNGGIRVLHDFKIENSLVVALSIKPEYYSVCGFKKVGCNGVVYFISKDIFYCLKGHNLFEQDKYVWLEYGPLDTIKCSEKGVKWL